ncbi:hypothetical protein MPH_04206 [Macrophomina phaseolina MS6]|uniref:Uncharacterized protein n=1 Tax=Macrophomina phaseolina (strain MS6) TaxID=1126212 RepID=K2S7P6_MACPH|nr:hypothetical protein MPH_04206 [Macrophomina phaseolina MS6]
MLTSSPDIAESDAQSEQDTELSDGDDTDADHAQTMGQALEDLNQAEQEIQALKTALSECWTLCNTLAGLSSIHRERMFTFSGQGDQGEQAWKSCWRLCQKLYESREEGSTGEVRPTLELCRDFCQALFEARHRVDEASDSVLRVSFELNNHLYNTADRNLPEAFRERTLDFYITLCHRLMKQRTSLPQETDSLLRACWSLAEMLFSIRQNTRDGKPADEELLGSAVQACWELCDLFREGWTQVRPDRGTPRPSQSTFPAPSYSNGHAQSQRGRSVAESERSLDLSFHSAKSLPPETPTTIFDDIAESSPDEPNVPNILVLGPENNTTRTHNRWSSSASTLSGYTDTSSQRTSSTATAGREDPHLMRLKTLILRAAMNSSSVGLETYTDWSLASSLRIVCRGVMPSSRLEACSMRRRSSSFRITYPGKRSEKKIPARWTGSIRTGRSQVTPGFRKERRNCVGAILALAVPDTTGGEKVRDVLESLGGFYMCAFLFHAPDWLVGYLFRAWTCSIPLHHFYVSLCSTSAISPLTWPNFLSAL